MKTEAIKSQAIIFQEGRLIEDASESAENRRLFWLMESEDNGIRFRILGDTPALAISSAESLAQEIGKYKHVRARAVYRWDRLLAFLRSLALLEANRLEALVRDPTKKALVRGSGP